VCSTTYTRISLIAISGLKGIGVAIATLDKPAVAVVDALHDSRGRLDVE
jgi:hypothetical protein